MSDVSYWYVDGIILKTDKSTDVNYKNVATLASQQCLRCFCDLEHMEARCM